MLGANLIIIFVKRVKHTKKFKNHCFKVTVKQAIVMPFGLELRP